jgi:tetratricopeptide (TPR) repeat protein
MFHIHCLKRMAATAAGAVVLTCAWAQSPAPAPAPPAAKQKAVKDQGEFEIYNQAIKDASNPQKEIQDLDAWSQKYPDSDFKDDRLYMYMQAYSTMQPPQPQKVIEYGQQLMSKDLNAVFPGAVGGRNILTVLFQVAWNVAALPSPTPEQLALGERAAKQLLDFAPKYFVAENKPQGTSDADWTKAKDDIEGRAKTALVAINLAPANQALAKNDYATAEQAYTKALGEYPNNASISYNLGRALSGLARANPDKAADYAPRAIYEFVRAAVVDPTLGGTVDAKTITGYAASVYTSYHGSEEGLDQLKQQVKASPLPPAGFAIETKAAVDAKKQKEFAEQNPQLALWMGIRSQLGDTNGQQYFEGQLKDAAVPKLKGVLIEGKPACRSKELLVAIPEPGQTAKTPEITLKLDAPLTGKPTAGDTIEWEGVPKAFTREPFMLTMETEKASVSGLKVEPCAAAPVHRPATKKK